MSMYDKLIQTLSQLMNPHGINDQLLQSLISPTIGARIKPLYGEEPGMYNADEFRKAFPQPDFSYAIPATGELKMIKSADEAAQYATKYNAEKVKKFLEKMRTRLIETPDYDIADPYYSSAEGVKIGYNRALQELKKHGRTLDDLQPFEWKEFHDLFDKETWTTEAQKLLAWLGY